jgi:hypothetical protein
MEGFLVSMKRLGYHPLLGALNQVISEREEARTLNQRLKRPLLYQEKAYIGI